MKKQTAVLVGAAALAGIAFALRKSATANNQEGGQDVAGGQDEMDSDSGLGNFAIIPYATDTQESRIIEQQAQMDGVSEPFNAPQNSDFSGPYTGPTFDGGFSSFGGGVGGATYNQRTAQENDSGITGSLAQSAAVIVGGGLITSGAQAAAVKSTSALTAQGVDTTAKKGVASIISDPYAVRGTAGAINEAAGQRLGTEAALAVADGAASKAPGPVARFLGKAAGFIPFAGTLTGAAADKYFMRNDPNKATWGEAVAANFAGDVVQAQATAAGFAVGGPPGAVAGTVVGFGGALATQEGVYKARGKSNLYDALLDEDVPGAASAVPYRGSVSPVPLSTLSLSPLGSGTAPVSAQLLARSNITPSTSNRAVPGLLLSTTQTASMSVNPSTAPSTAVNVLTQSSSNSSGGGSSSSKSNTVSVAPRSSSGTVTNNTNKTVTVTNKGTASLSQNLAKARAAGGGTVKRSTGITLNPSKKKK